MSARQATGGPSFDGSGPWIRAKSKGTPKILVARASRVSRDGIRECISRDSRWHFVSGCTDRLGDVRSTGEVPGVTRAGELGVVS